MDTNDFQKAFLRFLGQERGLAGSTVATYGHHLRGYLGFLKGAGYDLSAVEKDVLAGYIGMLRGRDLGAATIFCATVAIRAFHRFLVEKGHAPSDPSMNLPMPKLTPRLVEPLSVVEIERLLSAPSEYNFSGLRDRAILELLYCGLRLGEAMGLNIEHVHLSEEFVKVRGKGSKERLVPVGAKGVEALQQYLEAKDKRFGDTDGHLFLSRSGQRLSKNGFWRRFKRYAIRAGIKRRIYPHLMRHSCACHLLASHADLRSIQMLLGHTNLNTTQKYLGLNFATLQETCRRSHPRF